MGRIFFPVRMNIIFQQKIILAQEQTSRISFKWIFKLNITKEVLIITFQDMKRRWYKY